MSRKVATASADMTAIPEMGFLRVNQIMRFIPVSESTWWAGVKTGRFPKPIKMGKRTSVWKVGDIKEVIARIEKGDATLISGQRME